MTRLPSLRPWVLRAIVLTVVYGVAQAAFVALRSFSPDLMTLWSILLLAVVLAVGILWVGAEVVLDRQPPEWSWFFAALAAAPGAGLLSWILLALFVDDTGVADLGSALVGRASFTALLVLASVGVGSRLGWLSLRRHGEGANDPALDADDDEVARQAALDRAGPTEPATLSRATRAPRESRAAPAPAPREMAGQEMAGREMSGPTVAGVRTPVRRGRPEPAVEERERLPEASRLAGERRASRVRPATETDATPAPVAATSPFGPASAPAADDPGVTESTVAASAPAEPAPDERSGSRREGSRHEGSRPGGRTPEPAPESLAPPVVAVLPTTELPMLPVQTPPDRAATPAEPEPEPAPAEPAALRRRFGLRRPRS
jgi:hypothetical protein